MTAGLEHVEFVPEWDRLGFVAFTTTRAFGSLGLGNDEPVRDVVARWDTLNAYLRGRGIRRLATSGQVHGAQVVTHAGGWTGWLRVAAADGHAAGAAVPTALAVTVADCVPVFLSHPSGAAAILHSGWRGTEARIIDAGIDAMASLGCPASELLVHCGPAICGACYEVSADVYERLTLKRVDRPTPVDLRQLIAERARRRGVGTVTTSAACTRCDHRRFYSHRAGDTGRQISLIAFTGISSA